MSLKKLIVSPVRLRFQTTVLPKCYCTKSTKILESAEEQPVFVEDKDPLELERKRNKSRLIVAHRNILLDQNPYPNAMEWYHNTIRYKKRIFGRYGMSAVGVPAGFVWPSQEEIQEKKELENLMYSPDIKARLQKIKEKKKQLEDAIMFKQEKIHAKMANMKVLIAEVQEKVAKKQEAEEKAKLRKERKIEDIRRVLIAQGNASREKLEQALTLADKDEKKRKKELKKMKIVERQKKVLEQLAQQHLKGEVVDDEEKEDEMNPNKG